MDRASGAIRGAPSALRHNHWILHVVASDKDANPCMRSGRVPSEGEPDHERVSAELLPLLTGGLRRGLLRWRYRSFGPV
jgi:hypothetical protein